MDKLDKISTGAIIVFTVWALVLIFNQPQSVQRLSGRQAGKSESAGRYLDPGFDKKVTQIKSLLAAGNLGSAELLADKMISAYLFEGEPHALKGDIFLHQQKPVRAMLEYRAAVDLNPDFLDKKTDLFQGKKIRKTVEEARVIIDKELEKNPGNTKFKEDKKTIYYMLRKIAGSCG